MIRKITERISYFPAGINPLSSDIGIVKGDKYTYVYDVGSSDEATAILQKLGDDKILVLSHFHEDHIANIGRVKAKELYCSSITKDKVIKKTDSEHGIITVSNEPISFEDGIRIKIVPLPSTHSKGALGLVIDDEYAFIGDAIYGSTKNGRHVVNVTILKDMLEVIKKLQVKYLLLSHNTDFIQPADKIINELSQVYNSRKPGEAYISGEDV